jgi:hypothetical protein
MVCRDNPKMERDSQQQGDIQIQASDEKNN